MRFVDLTYVATRLRGSATGGAEVDVIFESAPRVVKSSKNTTRIARRRGQGSRAYFLKSNVVVMVSTGASVAKRDAMLTRSWTPTSVS